MRLRLLNEKSYNSMKYNFANRLQKLLILAAMLLLVTPLYAQVTKKGEGLYVLTNGRVRWQVGTGSAVREVPIGVARGSWKDSIPQGLLEGYTDTALLTEIPSGANYLALDLSIPFDQGTGTNLAIPTDFSPYCVWFRSGNSGYYYQEWEGYRYYLLASSTKGLYLKKVAVGETLEETTVWYDWDFGAAIQESYLRNGQWKNDYYWIMFGKTDNHVTLSCSSYERPETIIYRPNGGGNDSAFCYDAIGTPLDLGGNHTVMATGNGAMFMPVDTTVYPTLIQSVTPADKGLRGITLAPSLSVGAPLTYQQTLTATADVAFEGGVTVNITEPYTHYRVERKREGMNLNYNNRTEENQWLSKGTATYDNWYYYGGSIHTTAPTTSPQTLTQSDITGYSFRLNNAAKRYLTLTNATTNTCTVEYNVYSPYDRVDTLYLTVSYSNGAKQTVYSLIYLGHATTPVVREPENAPVIGAVFGGGRQADVNGNTNITLHRCDTVYAVYGGNDIAGSVSGTTGATITVGTANTNATHPVRIGSLYGGGNGYYNYQYVSGGTTELEEGVAMTAPQFHGSVTPWGATDSAITIVASAANGTFIPTITKTHITVATDNVIIDSLFGGAKNAYLTGSGDAVVQIDNVHGTVFAEFGGNNYGGNLGATSNTVTINVSGTRTFSSRLSAEQSTAPAGVENNFFHGFGRDFGIRYLYGGGNKVVAPTVAINVTGGMVDTLFAGGNSATVSATSCTVNATGANSYFTNTTAVASAPNSWVGGRANYNVRCLFGGNNQAEMAIRPTLTLTSGGIGTVYGGGNAGSMTADDAVGLTDVLAAIFTTPSGADSTGIVAPTKVGTSIAVTSNDMKIDYLYGGCNMADVTNATFVRLQGGQIGTVFGGCNISGDVGGGTYVVMDGTGPTVWANVFAGANGEYHCNNGAVYVYGQQFADNAGNPFDPYDDYLGMLIPTHNHTNLLMCSGTVYGNVYGGACMADVGNSTTKHGSVHLTMKGGTVKNNVYGGGNMAYVWGLGYLLVKGNTTIERSLYAGNDKVGRVESYDSYTGGGRSGLAFKASDGVTDLNKTVTGGYNSLFSTYLLLQGTPNISSVYGSGNGDYNYSNPSLPNYIELCASTSGDYRPIQSSTCIDINVTGGDIDTVFGGGNGVSVRDNLTLLLNAKNTTGEYVHYIFGGNNRDNMITCVPDILLTKGQVHDVYGGGNAGSMMGDKEFEDLCSNMVEHVSTHVKVTSDNAIINGNLYGGCNMADVRNMAYIDIRNTGGAGIANVFGGNNIGGKVYGNTRVDISGGTVGNIYGGSNGAFDYVEIGGDEYKVYPYGSTHIDDGVGKNLIATASMPDVDSTTVNIFGGNITNVYGGGNMGDCRATYVMVDDQQCLPHLGATITGSLFGGGAGDYDDLNKPRRGNVGFPTSASTKDTGSTNVHLYHAENLASAIAYGGGRGGDVYNSRITAYSTWSEPFNAIYGGCWGSDVYGTAYLTMNGTAAGTTANSVFGGNDFTGNVYKCLLTINGGTYGNIYGAGNGDYDTSNYTENTSAHDYSGANRLYVPNAEYVEVNFMDGTVNGNLYGGGKLGTTFSYLKNADGHYVKLGATVNDTVLVDIARNALADTVRTLENAYQDPMKYSYVLVNVHGGRFNKNIYAGGAGKDKQLVYGLKMLNMDGATTYVKESVYGGSENVHDGYGLPVYADGVGYVSGECVNDHTNGSGVLDSTTMRPSSIMNIAGGTIMNNVYGAGYMGNVAGSIFVNIGMDAIENSPVWTNTYNGKANAYALFKPGAADGYVPALTKNVIAMDASVYGGANWGTNTGSYNFDARGFFGGESRIFVDGTGYETDNNPTSTLPQMIIVQNIIGSGTSANGGDVLNRIDVQDYGTKSNDCSATRELQSIQRADVLWLWNTGIEYTGDNDAVSAYPSQKYTINRIKQVNARGYNLMEIDALMTNISEMNFYKDALASMTDYTVQGTLFDNSANDCPTNLCTKIDNVINHDTKKYTAIVVNNGVNIDIIGENGTYGLVNGFAYLMAEEGTNAIVAARSKSTISTVTDNSGNPVSNNVSDGGFMAECKSKNATPNFDGSENGWHTTWSSEDLTTNSEYKYENYYSNYRVWSIGQGRRSRYAVILAHANPSKLIQLDKPVLLPDTNTAAGSGHVGEGWNGYRYGLAYATLDLPASRNGNYYKLSASGIVLRDDNSKMDLADYAWNPVDSSQLKYRTESGVNKWWRVEETTGKWEMTNGERQTTADNIHDYPGSTFGLVMASGANFANDGSGHFTDPANEPSTWNNGATVITGNPNVSISNDYRSAAVGGLTANANPKMDLWLTYDTFFSTTLLGTVTFQLEEYQPGNATPVGTIDVTVTIATIIDQFINQEYEVLAMENEGRTNLFSRKAVLPATLEARDVYLESFTWYPTQTSGEGTEYTPGSELFYLTDEESVILADPDNNVFALNLNPTDNVSSTISSVEGWHDIEADAEYFSLYELAGKAANGQFKEPRTAAGLVSLIDGDHPMGKKIGQLDGRGLAALNIDLLFDGNKRYRKIENKGYVGKAILNFRSYKATEDKGPFSITVYVKTRDHGDTIYLASANSLSMTYGGEGEPTRTFGIGAWTRANHAEEWKDPKANRIGKEPSRYVNNFKDAFHKNVYQEGDVIAILGEVQIVPGQQLTIQGADYAAVPIIRYTGHHHEWPGEKAVYRGPMITVIGGEEAGVKKTTSFATRSIAFDGSSMGKRKNVKLVNNVWQIDTNYYPDTNVAYGPIIAVANNGGYKTAVSLENNTSIRNNYNASSTSAADKFRGAISVYDDGVLTLMNNVTIEQNLTVNQPTKNPAVLLDERIPHDGAVYVDHGVVELAESHKETAVTITDNYLFPATIPYSGAADTARRFWTNQYKKIPENPSATPIVYRDSLARYAFDATKKAIDTATRANVFLTRLPLGSNNADLLRDAQSDTIVFVKSIPTGTKIGVTKWFPGISVRDTIGIVMQPNGNLGYISEVMTHGNFYSDVRPYDTLYNNGIDNKTIFLHRCATFKQQIKDEAISALLPLANVPTGDALHYGYLKDATCPTGGDSIIYRVQGGFFPYTYTWSSSKLAEPQVRNTGVGNNVIMNGGTVNYNYAKAAIADTFYLPPIDMGHSSTSDNYDITVLATDAAGCRQKKVINVTFNKTDTGTPKWEKTGTTSYWTARDTANDHIATGDRNFKAIKIYPRVWANRTDGVITALVPGDKNDTIYMENGDRHDLDNLMFCEGDVIQLATAPVYNPAGTANRFIMWDFDPYYNRQVRYAVPSESDTVRAYYGPKTYWKDHINNVVAAKAAYDDNYYFTNRNGKSYVTTYHGDVHIYDEDGLAWFISVVNGYNGTQARSFFFNEVYLHDKDGGYDMKDYLWTPVGSQQHPFRGKFIGANKNDSDSCSQAGASRVVIKNIIIDEPNVDYTGFFGFLDSATVENIALHAALVRGAQYVGGLAANTRQSRILNCEVADSSNKNATATILATHYASGGMVGKADQSTIKNSTTSAKYVGDAVYNGGVVGYGTSTKVYNNGLRNISRMQSVYAGGVAGYLDGQPSDSPATRHGAKSGDDDGRSYVQNNYVYYTSQGHNQRAGGVVGYAKNTVIENNYVYGDIVGEATEGGVGAVLDEGSLAENNYYENGSATRSVGQHRNNATSSNNIDFSGEGNQVTLSSNNYGINNLTRALNIWVRAKGGDFKSWRSDLEHQNDGYPLFGTPDMIPVNDSLTVTGCDSVEWDGITYLFDNELVSHFVDSVMMVDSTFTLHIMVNHATREQVEDSVNVGDGYTGHGFELTETEVLMLYRTVGRSHSTTIVLTDTLQSAAGCDSIVTLMLTINPRLEIEEPTTQNQIHIYPNPTTSLVTVEATETMSHVELYDNHGRRLESYNARNSNDITIDVSHYPSGAYYLRVHTADMVTIQKLIKK